MPRGGPVPIQFPLSTDPGGHPQESAGRLINCFADPLGQGARSNARWRRSPGLVNFGTTIRSGVRGMIEIDDVLYAAFNGKLEKFTSAGGGSTNVGDLNGSAKCFLFRNNKRPTPDKFAVDPDQGAFVFTSSSVSSYPDGDLPNPNSGCAFEGYGIFSIADGRIFATDLNSTAVNILSFTTAESNPDGLLRVVPWGGRLLALGTRSIETYVNAGTTPFPLARDVVIARGLAGRYAIAGFEDGYQRALIFVGDDNAVYSLAGYNLTKISNPALDTLISQVDDKDDLEACCYTSAGHGFWQLSSSDWTWVFNVNSSTWHERVSYGLTRSRISTSTFAFNRWMVGDTETGNVQYLDAEAYYEIAEPFRLRIESSPVTNFPSRMRVARADFDITTGVGVATGTDPIQTDPVCEISWSDDGGVTWSQPLVRKLGRQTEGKGQISVYRTGITSQKGRNWRIDVADPVAMSIMGGAMSVEARR